MLHRGDDLGVIEYQSAAAQACAALFLKLLVAQVKIAFCYFVSRRNVQHSGRDDLMTVQLMSVFAQREQVQQHLKIHAVQHVRKLEIFASGLIVDNAQIELALMQPAVNAVGDSGQDELILTVAELQRWQLRRVRKVELERQRLEIAAAQLVGKIESYLMHAAYKAAEQVFKALALIAEIIELAPYVFRNVLVAQCAHRLVADAFIAAHGDRLACDLLQDPVHEGSQLRCREARRLVRPCLERVLHEVGKAAGGEFVDPRRGKA